MEEMGIEKNRINHMMRITNRMMNIDAIFC